MIDHPVFSCKHWTSWKVFCIFSKINYCVSLPMKLSQDERNKNSAEVDIAPALDEIITACNVGQAKSGHDACMESTARTNTMLGYIITATEKCTLVVDST